MNTKSLTLAQMSFAYFFLLSVVRRRLLHTILVGFSFRAFIYSLSLNAKKYTTKTPFIHDFGVHYNNILLCTHSTLTYGCWLVLASSFPLSQCQNEIFRYNNIDSRFAHTRFFLLFFCTELCRRCARIHATFM